MAYREEDWECRFSAGIHNGHTVFDVSDLLGKQQIDAGFAQDASQLGELIMELTRAHLLHIRHVAGVY